MIYSLSLSVLQELRSSTPADLSSSSGSLSGTPVSMTPIPSATSFAPSQGFDEHALLADTVRFSEIRYTRQTLNRECNQAWLNFLKKYLFISV
jgi:hypothetical protein